MKKLTQEVFDLPECPDWAKSAAVDSFGDGYYYSERASNITHDDTHNFPTQYSHKYKDKFLGKFDATNWQQSAIDKEST